MPAYKVWPFRTSGYFRLVILRQFDIATLTGIAAFIFASLLFQTGNN